MKHLLFGFLVTITTTLGLVGCFQDEFELTTDPNAALEFSLDTLRFDTVFTELGSATRSFKIYNRKNITNMKDDVAKLPVQNRLPVLYYLPVHVVLISPEPRGTKSKAIDSKGTPNGSQWGTALRD